MVNYGTPTDPTRYGQVHGPAAIVSLTTTAEGHVWRSEARVIEPGSLASVMPVMGVRLFYGIHPDGEVVEFCLTSRAFATAERTARAECDLLWEPGAFVGETWEVYGERRQTTWRVDLSPIETTAHAMAWGRALGLAR